MFNILLFGAGQLGSRYLQGLVGARCRLGITVVDPSRSSIEMAKARWIEAGGERCHHQIRWVKSVPPDLKNADIVLVLTSAEGRSDLVKRVASQVMVNNWVLEKVLAQSVAEIEVIAQATAKSRGAWINTPRRMMAWHQSLKKIFEAKGPIKATYSSEPWGLTCNSIHFFDLISWWIDEELDSIDTTGLDTIWFESKRRGYFEVNGSLVAHFSEGSTLVLEARDHVGIHPLDIHVADGTTWKIDELKGIGVSSNGDHLDGRIELQSQLAGRMVDDILLRGHCDLPTLKQSAAMHAVFLKAMLKHWNLSQKRNDVSVPIT